MHFSLLQQQPLCPLSSQLRLRWGCGQRGTKPRCIAPAVPEPLQQFPPNTAPTSPRAFAILGRWVLSAQLSPPAAAGGCNQLRCNFSTGGESPHPSSPPSHPLPFPAAAAQLHLPPFCALGVRWHRRVLRHFGTSDVWAVTHASFIPLIKG